ncbi:predicted protein [Histoplasma mississippiense (nom. inval.)]|uniref:predicted protein n=1 Tax=Ajellomyces capsulatus (strain NAm1 / WU24) TaxID=2059318 RepID=UPI000157B5FE|nr:predicted protein [Histoplasma mississippiense (nom. inval.)]EDN02648.1 predicted protein [Histoplasma mississippiense (nom. inval.)]
MSQPNSLKVLLLPFPGFDTLDLYAPIEVLGKGAAIGGLEITFEIATIAQPTLSAEKVPVYRTLSISQAMMQLDQYEIVIQPGAGISKIEKYLETPELLGLDPSSVREHLQLLLTFSQMTTPSPRGLAGLAGVFSNMVVTTHYEGLEKLGEYCRMAGQGTVIEPDIGNGGYEGYSNAQQHSWRWVTVNRPGFGVNVISSGGISCGLDASLYLLSELEVIKDGQREKVGIAKAHRCARIMEYAWRWA